MKTYKILLLALSSVFLIQCISTSPIHRDAPESIDINHYVSYEIKGNVIEFKAHSDDITNTEPFRQAQTAADRLNIERGFTDSISDPFFWVRFEGDIDKLNFDRSEKRDRNIQTLMRRRSGIFRVTLPRDVITENPLANNYYRNIFQNSMPGIHPSVLKVSYNRKSVLRKNGYEDAFWYLKKPDKLYRLTNEQVPQRYGRPLTPENNIEIRFWQAERILRVLYTKNLNFEVRDYESAMPIQGAEIIINGYYINGERATTTDILNISIVNSPYRDAYRNFISTQNMNNLFGNTARTNARGLLEIRTPRTILTEVEITADILVRSNGYERFEGIVNLTNDSYIVSLPALGTRIDVRTKEVLTPAIRGN